MSLSVWKTCFPLASLDQKKIYHYLFIGDRFESTYFVAFPIDLSTALWSEDLLGDESRIGYINGTS
jgi:hypothetical protein